MHRTLEKSPVATSIAAALVFTSMGIATSSAMANDVVSGIGQTATNDADPGLILQDGVEAGNFRFRAGETDVTVSGYAKADFIFDSDGDRGDSFNSSGIPTGDSSADTHFRAHARQSRLRVRTSTDVGGGKTLKAHIEGDFFGGGGNELVSNSASFRLRHAYFTIGGWTVGQFWTNFMDFVALPGTVDFFGPAGRPFARQAQLRYTFSNGVSLSIENPETDGNGGAAGSIPESLGGIGREQLPDLIGAWRGGPGGAGGKYEAAVVVRSLGVGGDVDDSVTGFGINLAGAWDLGVGTVAASFVTGTGIGRYIISGINNALLVTDDNDIEAVSATGASLSYTHRWTAKSNTVVAFGTFQNDDDFPANGTDSVSTLHVNYQWKPTDNTNYGVEFIAGDRETSDGESGSVQRLQFGAQFNF